MVSQCLVVLVVVDGVFNNDILEIARVRSTRTFLPYITVSGGTFRTERRSSSMIWVSLAGSV